MEGEANKERVRADMEADFLPEPSPDTLSQVDRRMANAAEYIAYHLGQIDKKLDRLIALLETSAQKKVHERLPPQRARDGALDPSRRASCSQDQHPEEQEDSGGENKVATEHQPPDLRA